ncbi:MAG: endonuclease/exonuclease/phosphatase family protein [Aquabacterium sp.]|jgi:endonuclease/exonuclease/phosphatase family metal-dependent hydrolase|nr:endonuclease/exonuclease/phosphatase family protein [Aquabacterium sp.]MBP9063595.1 endonuclease/exonuclease/phosphatase family protein [Aquabacterium sp.]
MPRPFCNSASVPRTRRTCYRRERGAAIAARFAAGLPLVLKPLQSSLLPPVPRHSQHLRVATYNIHKGVRGMGPAKRLEIHNLSDAVAALDADIVCLQEVRQFNHAEARHFSRTQFGPDAWPSTPQAEYLAPEGYEVAYRTNAVTKHGEHGNALLARWPLGAIGHHNVSDHRFEQRGLLHVPVIWRGIEVHVVVVHLGLIHASRVRQAEKLAELVQHDLPPDAPVVVAGDFNDWNEKLDDILGGAGLSRAMLGKEARVATYPSIIPVLSLDRVYTRGMQCKSIMVPRGSTWARLSDHLPLVAELDLST